MQCPVHILRVRGLILNPLCLGTYLSAWTSVSGHCRGRAQTTTWPVKHTISISKSDTHRPFTSHPPAHHYGYSIEYTHRIRVNHCRMRQKGSWVEYAGPELCIPTLRRHFTLVESTRITRAEPRTCENSPWIVESNTVWTRLIFLSSSLSDNSPHHHTATVVLPQRQRWRRRTIGSASESFGPHLLARTGRLLDLQAT
jgi:hypothetical protein